MAYSNEVVRKARAELASRKADHESQTLDRLQRAYAAVPRIREIDNLLRRSMAVAMQTVFQTGGDAQKAMAEVKQANLSLQAERKALIEANFGPGYLDETPICPHCGGSGYIGTSMCRCLKELCRREQEKEVALLADAGIECVNGAGREGVMRAVSDGALSRGGALRLSVWTIIPTARTPKRVSHPGPS